MNLNLFLPSPQTLSNHEPDCSVSTTWENESNVVDNGTVSEGDFDSPELSPLIPVVSSEDAESAFSEAFDEPVLTTLQPLSQCIINNSDVPAGEVKSSGQGSSPCDEHSKLVLKAVIDNHIERLLKVEGPLTSSRASLKGSFGPSQEQNAPSLFDSNCTPSQDVCTITSTSSPSRDTTEAQSLSLNETAAPSSKSISTTASVTKQRSRALLLPCRVCGEDATGFHFGVTTCEACKIFFRRSLKRQKKYICLSGTDTCNIMPARSRLCQKCRYQKCLDVGMAVEAIKTGRRTHSRTAQVIKEVKRIQAQQRNEGTVAVPTNNPPNTADQTAGTHAEAWKGTPHLFIQGRPLSIQLDEELQAVCQRIIQVAESCDIHMEDLMSQIPKSQAEYLEVKRLKEELFGPMSNIPYEEARQIYKQTGFDLDGNKQLMHNSSIFTIEENIKRLITFAKGVPGFKELPMNDQIGLVKNSRFEVYLIGSDGVINVEHGLITVSNGSTYSGDELPFAADKEFIDDGFRLVARFRQLQLTKEEISIFKALPLVLTDRCELERPDKVEEIQQKLLTILEYLFKKNHPADKNLFARALVFLADTRLVADRYMMLCKKIVLDWDVELPPLTHELIF